MEDQKQYLPIKYWSEDDRPREKLLQHGKQTLSNAELLAILIGSGSKNESAVDLCKRILTHCDNDLNQLGKMEIADFMKFKGVGPAKAISIVAALELAKRRDASLPKDKLTISSSKDAFNVMSAYFEDLSHEEFWVLLLNRANKVIDKCCVSKGGISGTLADIRIILKQALDKNASAIIALHNHPSGQLRPSQADINLTKRLKESAKLMEIALLDHIIAAGRSFYSFADKGQL